ncbi:MAG: hypothetical protein FWC92_04860 [Defluviitaleaceae bacterium]|nr:hypothetical protein [Defluviitaleaceae bacterium]
MRYSSDDALMAKCKDLDFSVESANYDKNLEILKGKLANINEERCRMKGIKKLRKPLVILVAVIAIMAMSVATLAAASPALRDRVARAVRHEDGTLTISVPVDMEDIGEGGTVRVRIGEEADGTLFIESDCGTQEIINVIDAADLCPDDVLMGMHGELSGYSFMRRPDYAPGLEAFTSYTSDLNEITVDYFTGRGFGTIEVDIRTIFYRMLDDYGVTVAGAAVLEANGYVYFVAECGERTRIAS